MIRSINRRGFLAGLGVLLAAPAIIRTPGLLMPLGRYGGVRQFLPYRIIFDPPLAAHEIPDLGYEMSVLASRYEALIERNQAKAFAFGYTVTRQALLDNLSEWDARA